VAMAVSFGDFAFDPERRQLLRLGEPVPLETKAYELLALLLSRRPNALSKAQIRSVLWPGTFVSESALARLVTQLRAACGDDAQNPRFIRTVHGFGYAFCGEASESGDGRPAVAGEGERGAAGAACPYPGLSPFVEEDAERFFGREGEVEALCQKVRRQELLALIGPSGVGKTSFLRAGLIPRRPAGWGAVACTPGSHPFVALGQALAPLLAADAEGVKELFQGVSDAVQGEEPTRLVSAASRWRRRHAEALLVLDQFEELFTLNPPQTQARFTRLVGRLVAESGLRIVLGLRDDFFMRCGEHPDLAPVFHDVTPLLPPSAEGLKRALREPAARQGVSFEDEALVAEMTEAVSAERGALPLLAFAASRLWEERDRERGRLTREAYERIGGMGGALAQHAEATLQRLGIGREPMVRELFRNLVTAEGTRASRGRDELLSVFGDDRREAGEMLDALVAARLLTSYDVNERVEVDGTPGTELSSPQRIEIVHESLLTHWPRLVRWQTQDADGAQLRDQLRQAAELWHDRGRPEDLLWTGTAYRDLALWRERHRVPLTASETAFVRATETRASRRRRRRRAAVAGLLAGAAGVAVATSFLWQRAEAETRRAEASRLLTLAQLERETYPTAALAWVTRSLELADAPEARFFALGILQEFPTAVVVPMPANDMDGLEAVWPAFSPSGEWLAVGGLRRILLLNRDGRPPRALGDYASMGFNGPIPEFAATSDRLFVARLGDIRMLSIPDGREIWRHEGARGFTWPRAVAGGFMTATRVGSAWVLRSWPTEGGEPRLMGSIENASTLGLHGSHAVYRQGRKVLLRSLSERGGPITIGEMQTDSGDVGVAQDGRVVAASDEGGEVRVWRMTASGAHLIRVFRAPDTPGLRFDDQGRRLLAVGSSHGTSRVRVFDLEAPPGAEPLVVQRSDEPYLNAVDLDASGRWLAAGTVASTSLWALHGHYPYLLKAGASDLAFTRDGRTLLVIGSGLEAWPLGKEAVVASRSLYVADGLQFPGIAVDPNGERAAIAGGEGRVAVIPLDGGSPRELRGFSDKAMLRAILFAEGGRLVAAAPFYGPREEKVLRVWDLDSGAARTIGPVPGAGEGFTGAMRSLHALGGQDQAVAGVEGYGLVQFDLRTSSWSVLTRDLDRVLASSQAAGLLLACHYDRARETCSPVLVNPDTGVRTPLTTHGDSCSAGAFDPSGTVVATGSVRGGTVRVGPVSGEEPHVLVGHGSDVQAMAFSPDGRWLAVSDQSSVTRLWPVPDVERAPFHVRPLADVMATLRSHTNLRAVPDRSSPRGYKLEPEPFAGWATPPDW
jgi:DNA-binding winged helix-turn-helix (wHTH) protein/WD40 repeat protein